jgi:hypothetical protein
MNSELFDGLLAAENAGSDEIAFGIVYSENDIEWIMFEGFIEYFKTVRRAISVQ